MLSAQTNYHVGSKDTASTVDFVNNILQHSEANNYLSNINTLSHVSKMCVGSHWPPVHPHHHQAQINPSAAAAAAVALAAGHNIESILGSYNVKSDNDKKLANQNNKNTEFNSSYEAGELHKSLNLNRGFSFIFENELTFK